MEPLRREHLAGPMIVWIASVRQARDSLIFLEGSLDERDRERAARFRFAEDRERFVLGRGLLRKGLGRYLQRDAETVELAYTDRGRPFLADDETVQFSISHAHDLVAIALTAEARIGIDLEYVQSDLDFLGLAERIFSEGDLQAFRGLAETEAPSAFYRAWTRKEAYLKARGEGIAERLRQVSVSLNAEEVGSIRDGQDGSGAPTWRLIALPLPANYLGSVACDDPGKRLECSWVDLDQGKMIWRPCPTFSSRRGEGPERATSERFSSGRGTAGN